MADDLAEGLDAMKAALLVQYLVEYLADLKESHLAGDQDGRWDSWKVYKSADEMVDAMADLLVPKTAEHSVAQKADLKVVAKAHPWA